jgi:hypothetical protein
MRHEVLVDVQCQLFFTSLSPGPGTSTNPALRWWSSKKKLPLRLAVMKALYGHEASAAEPLALRYGCGDESRFGLKTIPRRRINAFGVKPIGPQQWLFQAYYLYGLVEPSTDEHFVWEFSHCV